MDIPQILSVHPQDDKKLLVKFNNGVEKMYDCKQILHLDAFQFYITKRFSRLFKLM